MKPITIAETQALLKKYGLGDEDISSYVDYYSTYLEQVYMQTYVNFYYNGYYIANVFIYVLYGIVGLIMLIALGLRVFNHYSEGRRLPRAIVKLQTFILKHLYLSSGIGTRSMEPVGPKWASVQIPIMVHSILVFIFVAFNFIVAFAFYDPMVPNLWYQDMGYPFDQLLRYFSDRTGIIAFGLTPLAIALAGRNSAIAMFTGASYSTLQIYHRWVARAAFWHGLAHGVAYTLEEWLASIPGENYLKESFSEEYWNWGCAAIGGGALLAFFSHRPLRELWYEAFLIGHIAGAVLWVVGCYYHVWYLDPDYSFLKYIYASIALWGADRAFRWVRLAYLNTPSFFGSQKSGSKRTRRTAEGYLIGSGDFIRLRITMPTSWGKSAGGPGSYVFITSLKQEPWANHPFTITWPTGMPETSTTLPSTPSGSEPEKSSYVQDSLIWTESDDNANSFELVLKSYGGFTRKLRRAIAASSASGSLESGPSSIHKVQLLVEGPYGHGKDLSQYETILLVSGGSGVSATISHLADLAKYAAKGTLRTQRVVLLWAIRNASDVTVILPYLIRLRTLFPNVPVDFLQLHVFYTGETSSPEPSTSSKSSFKSSGSSLNAITTPLASISDFCHLEAHHGRPTVGIHLDRLTPFAEGRIAVSACGPAGLCDDTRETVRSRIGKQGLDAHTLLYHDEVFTW